MSKKVFLFLSSLSLFFSFAVATVAQSSSNPWTRVDDSELRQAATPQAGKPDRYTTFRLDKTTMRSILNRAPEEFASQSRSDGVVLSLPLPEGGFGRFRIEHSPIVEAGLLEKYPELGETYVGHGIDDVSATVRLDFLPSGFHAMIRAASGTVFVDPYAEGDTENYISYFKSDFRKTSDFECEVGQKTGFESIFDTNTLDRSELVTENPPADVISGTQLRTYRLAVAATVEYTGAVGGGTVSGALAAQVLVMNRVNGVYERDVAIRMVIVANNDSIIYTAEPDPYTNSSGSTMLGQNQTNLDTVIGSANYDIGHVFSTGGGGIASLRSPCTTGKARGVTGQPNPIGDPFAIDYVAHEMGHQWGGNHTMNGCSRTAAAAYEPGSGITIMAYAGICGSQDLAGNSIDTFHVKSLEEIVSYSQTGGGNACAVATASGNTPPSVSVVGGPSFNIPKQTAFALTATGSDVNGDSITYDWQEYDLGPSAAGQVPNNDADGQARPIFRPYLPTASGTRYFPSLQYILNNANVPPSTDPGGFLTGELLPAITRTMQFQVIARDNRANAGGINTATATVNVDGVSGPFNITAPNTGVTWAGGSSQTVTWNVAGTAGAPVSAANVKISLSADGGQTFPTTVLASTANDGSETITVPNVSTTQARIKVEAVGNIFFDVSDANFTVTSSVVTPKRFDFDGDGKADASVYRSGTWYILQSLAGYTGAAFGIASDKLAAADYDGDGKTDIAVFRDGTWYAQRSQAGIFIAPFGSAGDVPIPGDYTGDGKADLAVYRGGTWYIYNIATGAVTINSFGLPSDKPVVGDWDGDGRQDLAVYRPSNGTWYVSQSTAGFTAVNFGLSTDTPVPADFDGDGKTDYAVYRGGTWYVFRSQLGITAFAFGNSTDIPAPADYDGDAKADAAVYRDGVWYQQRSTAGIAIFNFGLAGDKVVPAQQNQ